MHLFNGCHSLQNACCKIATSAVALQKHPGSCRQLSNLRSATRRPLESRERGVSGRRMVDGRPIQCWELVGCVGFLFGKRMYIIIYSTIRNVGRFGRSSLLEFGKKRGPLECQNFGRGPKPQETAGESESRRGPLRWPTLRSPLSLKIWET